MPVTYTRTVWRNHIVRRPRTYTETTNADGSRTDTPAPGDIWQQGTALDEEHLNNLEEGVVTCVDGINDLDERKIEETIYAATIPTSGWSGNAAPFSLNLTVNGIRATDVPIIDIIQSGTYATDTARRDSWGGISRITTAANTLNITADYLPTVALPIQVRCLR